MNLHAIQLPRPRERLRIPPIESNPWTNITYPQGRREGYQDMGFTYLMTDIAAQTMSHQDIMHEAYSRLHRENPNGINWRYRVAPYEWQDDPVEIMVPTFVIYLRWENPPNEPTQS